MKAERWKQINDLFQSATECPPEKRAAFLDQACQGDKSLCREVESLIASYERAENFIEAPAFQVAPELLTNDRAGALVGESIGHYRIESLIGVGGMGEVYLARDERLGRKVALKLLPEHMTANEAQLSRFKTEARSASALNHPNILTVYEIGTEGHRQFIATEFIEGITLRAALARGRMNLRDALEIAVQVASALAAAHETGVVHRDIKPENIMLRPDGYAKVLDFGIAKLTEQQPGSDFHDVGTTTVLQTRPGLVLGTAHYMSPEQTRGQTLDARSDIWSLGVVVYEMVGGSTPFPGETPSDCIASILKTEPPPLSGVLPGVPVKLQSIVQKTLRKNREERYQTIKEMLADLRDLKGELELEGSSPQTKARAEPIVSKIKRHKQAALLILAATILAAAAFAYAFYFVAPAPAPNEKSIAVLPFADLSQARDQEYFCDGIQEEILTRLSKIRDLKVISRTSTQRFKSAPKNLPEIAKQLGVATILEGTVQKAEGQVRVNVQLINARSDSHLWAEKYDRKLIDMFQVESDVAQKIAASLEAKLTGREKQEVAFAGTKNPEAYDAFLHALALSHGQSLDDERMLAEYSRRAVELDPNYAEAWALLGVAEAQRYFFPEHTEAQLARARTAAETALRLAPDLAAAHEAIALFYYYCLQDFDHALTELSVARERAPNNANVLLSIGLVQRRQGEMDDSINIHLQASKLDPLNQDIWVNLGRSYRGKRQFEQARAMFDRGLAITPDDIEVIAQKAETYIAQGDIDTAWRMLKDLKFPPTSRAFGGYLNLLVYQRRYDDAIAFISSALEKEKNVPPVFIALSHSSLADFYRVKDDQAKARTLYLQAEKELQQIRAAGDNGMFVADRLLQVEARLGHGNEVEQLAAANLKLIENDKWGFAREEEAVARAYTTLGDFERALPLLQHALETPCVEALTPAYLRIDPEWDPVRNDPRFAKLVEGATQPVAPEPAAESTPDKSIAVLPFADLSQARDQEYFCDGIQEEILTRLSKIADLKVISRTSTQRYKSAPGNLPEIARQLGVANILEGTVQKAQGQVRVHVQLINARNDSHLWAEKYDRRLTDVFGVESEIAKAIADTLQAKLSGAEQRAIATRPTENPEAHQLYLKGTFFSNKRTGPDFRTAIDYFKNAIGKDANYALAYAGLADAYALLSLYGGEGPQETVSQAKAAARKALELEDTLPEAHNSLGLVLALHDFDFAQSKKEFERAIELNPNYATAHHQFGNMNLTMVGEFDRAIAEGKRAVELDPLSLIINSDLGVNFLLARRYDEAIDQLRKTLAMDPRFYPARYSLGEALQLKGQLDEAMVEYQKAAEVRDDPVVLAYLAQGYAKTGKGDKAWNLLSQLEQLATERHVGPFILAMVHLALGEKEKAVDELERAYRERADPFIVGIKVEPLLDPLRGDPRFERLVAKVFGSAESRSPAQPAESKSIAVLPFENLSSEPETAYFADGIQEEILTRLSKIRDLKVISRTSTQRYKSAPGNLPEIARQLGVANILEGTVQKAEGQVRVHVQLINARNDSHLWANKYDRKLTDIFAVESEIAGKIADSLQVKLSGAEQKALQAYPTESTEAHQLYLRGRYVMEKRTPADLNKAAEYFNQAIALDPNYAAAYAGLADCYVLLPQWKQGPVAEYLSKARAAANKALQIDGNLADAHASLGMIAFGEKLDLREAKREFEHSIRLNPNYALAHYCLGYSVLLALGNHDQAIAELKRAIELDPVSSVINTNLGYAYVLARRYPEAIAQLRKTIELDPSFAYAHAILGEALELNGQLNDALTEYEKSYVVGHDYRGLMMMARVHGLKGDRARALQLFEQAKQLSSPDIWAFGCAMVYVGLGDRNETLNWLEQSYRQKEFINLSTIKEDPLFDSLRGDPRFEKLVSQILPQA